MVDILLDKSGDIALINGKIQLTKDKAQAVKIRLKTIRGEYFLDVNIGVPYFTEIFTKRNKKERIDMLIKSELSRIKDFVKFDSFVSEINEKTYEYKANIQFKNKEIVSLEESL